MIERFFLKHPRSVGESYGEHFLMAFSFASRMLGGGFILLIHAAIPGLFVQNGSRIIDNLHARMIRNRVPTRQDVDDELTQK